MTVPARRIVALAAISTLFFSSACTGTASEGDDVPDDAATRSVEHARGVAEVPADPQRVVVLEPVQLDTSVALGVTPVGTAVLSAEAGVPAYLGEEAAGIEPVGTVPEPDVEKIASLEPDLILGTDSRHAALYEQLSDIAPTVFLASQADPWQENVRLTAEALGDTEGAEDLLEEYQARCGEIEEQHETDGRSAQLIRPRDGLLTLYGPESFAGSTLECAGFEIPERDWEDSISVDLSPELAQEAAADLTLVTTTDTSDESQIPDAVRNDSASFPDPHLVDQSFWITGVGPLGGQVVLDDLDRILSES